MLKVTKSDSKITIKDEGIAKKIFDLKDHKGERIRVYIGKDNKLTIETRPKQELLICELDIPEREYIHTKTTEKDEKGEYIIETKEKELKLEEVEMKEYLKEVEKKTK